MAHFETTGRALQRAIAAGQTSVVRRIIESPGFDINAPSDPGSPERWSPLMLALLGNHIEIIELILRHPGLDLVRSLPRYDSWTWVRSCSLALLKRVLEHRASLLNQQDANGKGLLHEVVRADRAGIEKLDYLLARSGCIVDLRQGDGTTPLYQASMQGNSEAVSRLLAHGADVNNRNTDNLWTVLMVAVAQEHSALLRLLLERPEIDVNARSDSGDTALHIATGRNLADCVGLLLMHPAIDVNAKNAIGRTALTIAALHDRTGILRMLCARPELDPNLVDRDRQTALHWAVMAAHPESIRVLAERRDLNFGITNRPAKQTALDIAEASNQPEIAALLRAQATGRRANDSLSPGDAYTPRTEAPPAKPVGPFFADPPFR